ncbi:ALMA7, partial [Symbiodinium microadriaticum]
MLEMELQRLKGSRQMGMTGGMTGVPMTFTQPQQALSPIMPSGPPMYAMPHEPSGPAPSLANIETKNHSEIMQAYKDIVKSLQESQQKHNDLLQRHSDLTKHHVELMRAHQELLESLKKGGAGGGGGGAAAGQPKKNRAKHPALGVVRLDYDYPPAPGDSDHPGSFGYEVYYRCCPGLTFEMCQEGHFPEAVERRFADAIKHLEEEASVTVGRWRAARLQAEILLKSVEPDKLCAAGGGKAIFKILHEKYSPQPIDLLHTALKFTSAIRRLEEEDVKLPPAVQGYLLLKQLRLDSNQRFHEEMLDKLKDANKAMVCSQKEYANNVEIISIRERGRHKDQPLTASELSELRQLRGVMGAASSLVGSTRPDIVAQTVILQQKIGLPTVQKLIYANRVVARIKDVAKVKITFKAIPFDQLMFVAASDASWNDTDVPKMQGYMTMADENEVLANMSVWAKARRPDYTLQNDLEFRNQTPLLVATDNKPSYDHSQRDGIVVKRVAIDMLLLQSDSEARGCSAITGDCGFMMAFHVIARKIAAKPIFMSSMVQCPIIAASLEPSDQILLLTANDKHLKPQKQVLLSSCGFDVDEDRFLIKGCQMVPGFEAVALGGKVPLEVVQPGIVKLVQEARKEHPRIAAILLECTELPPYADALRYHTGLPVWDAVTAADFYISAHQDNPRFGHNDWQEAWDGTHEEYELGLNLTKDELSLVVSKHKVKEEKKSRAVHKKKKLDKVMKKVRKQQAPMLGVLRLDYNYPPAEGDIDHPGSYDYDVLFRVVPGFTFEMAQAGKLSPDVEKEFIEAVKWLENKGCSGITG